MTAPSEVSGEDPREQREQREIALQRLVDDLAARYHGRPLAEVTAELERRLAEHGFEPQPSRWVDAAASAAARGERYVVSLAADRATGPSAMPDATGPEGRV